MRAFITGGSGFVTTLFTINAAMIGAIGQFGPPAQIASATVAGLAADAIVRWLRPSPRRPVAFHAVGLLVPLATWGAWFGAVALSDGIGWSPEIWTGTMVWCGIMGLALSALLLLPPSPAAAVAGHAAQG